MKDLLQYINNINVISQESAIALGGLFEQKRLKKGDFFAREGEYAQKIGFLQSGILRAFFINFVEKKSHISASLNSNGTSFKTCNYSLAIVAHRAYAIAGVCNCDVEPPLNIILYLLLEPRYAQLYTLHSLKNPKKGFTPAHPLDRTILRT